MSVLYTYIILILYSLEIALEKSILHNKSPAHHTEFPCAVDLADPKGSETAREAKNCATNLQKLPATTWGVSIIK